MNDFYCGGKINWLRVIICGVFGGRCSDCDFRDQHLVCGRQQLRPPARSGLSFDVLKIKLLPTLDNLRNFFMARDAGFRNLCYQFHAA